MQGEQVSGLRALGFRGSGTRGAVFLLLALGFGLCSAYNCLRILVTSDSRKVLEKSEKFSKIFRKI